MRLFYGLIVAVTFVLVSAGAHAQLPDKFTNLKVLPKDISKQDLLSKMKSFSMALGVRCTYCHVGEEGKPFSEFDFASDDKKHKLKARAMIEMSRTINDDLLEKLGDMRNRSIRVECVTCHRGVSEPRMLEDVLAESALTNGVDSTVAEYRQLREDYYGGFSYDFGEASLLKVAERLAGLGSPDDAMAMMSLNLEFFPQSWQTYYQMGEVCAAGGQKEQAIQNMEKAFGIMPNPRIKKRIEQLTNG